MKSALSETIAIALNRWLPSEYALNNAVRSAQIVKLKELFSTLQPVNIFPEAVNAVAPTRKFEYGACAYFFAATAAAINFLYCGETRLLVMTEKYRKNARQNQYSEAIPEGAQQRDVERADTLLASFKRICTHPLPCRSDLFVVQKRG